MQSSQDSSQFKLTYFSLVQKVGDKGCYQWLIYLITLSSWFFGGICFTSLSFIFLQPGFNCASLGISEINCQKYVCSHFVEEVRKEYEKQKEIESLATEFGPYNCQKTYIVAVFKSLLYVGMSLSVFVVNFFINNISRKKVLVTCSVFAFVGSLMLVLSSSMAMACISLVLIGMGIQIPNRFLIAIISQITEKNLAKKFISSLYGATSISAILTSVFYNQIKHWRYVSLYFMLIPYFFILIFILLLFEDTPQSLLKSKTGKEICQSLNRIGRINYGEDNLISEEQVEEFLEEERKVQQVRQGTNPLDLFRYSSLRLTTIVLLILSFILSIISNAHSMLINQIGFNPTLNQFLINVAELIGGIFLVFFTEKMKRKLSAIVVMVLSTILSLCTYAIYVPPNCQLCSEVFFQMGTIFLFKFMFSIRYMLIFLSCSEFYPVSIRSVSLGTMGTIWCFGSSLSIILFTDVEQIGINPFLLVGILSFVMVGFQFWVPETLNIQNKDQIEEVEEEKNKEK